MFMFERAQIQSYKTNIQMKKMYYLFACKVIALNAF